MSFDPAAARPSGVLSDNPLYQGGIVCYINGLEVPIIGFDIDSGVWEIPTFRVHLAPDPLLSRFGHEDKVPVALFYLDTWYDETKPERRLLCDGEILGWAFSSSQGQRSLALSCIASIQIFQQLYFFYMTNVDDIVASRSPDVVAQGFTTPGLIYPYALFHQGLIATPAQVIEATPGVSSTPAPPTTPTSPTTPPTPAPATTPSPLADPDAGVSGAAAPIQAPYEFVTNAIKGCISSAVPNERRAVPMMNYFAQQVRKSRLHNRFVRLPILEDPVKLRNRVGVFPIFNAARNTEALLAMQRNTVQQVGNAGSVWDVFLQVLGMVFMEIGMVPNPCAVIVKLNDTSGGGNPTDGRILGPVPGGEHVVDQRPTPPPAPAPTRGTSPSTTGGGQELGITPRTPIRLAQYFVKPQNYFGVAPSCNVIFPSMLKGWTYDENYAQQPTRTYINDALLTQLLRAEGPNREFMLHSLMAAYPEEAHALLHHRAGTIPSTASGQAAASAAAAAPTESGKNLLIWPEEFFKGPVTARAQPPAWFQMLRQFSNARASAEGGGTPGGASDTNLLAPPAIQPTGGVSPDLTAPRTGVQIITPARPDRRGGRTSALTTVTRARLDPNWRDRWIILPEVAERIRNFRVEYTAIRVADMGGRDQLRWRPGQSILKRHLLELFPNFNTSAERTTIQGPRGTPRHYVHDDPTHARDQVDDHQGGIALDLMIPEIGGRPNRAVGDPVVYYLLENAETLGIAFLVWCRSQYHFMAPVGSARRFHHDNHNPSVRMDHTNHIHITLSLAAANAAATMPFYTSRYRPSDGVAPTVIPAPVRTVVIGRPTAPPAPVTPGTSTTAPTPVTPGTPSAVTTGIPVTEAPSFNALFALYAQYEHLRKRYHLRSAGAMMLFNPYIIAGFPTFLFDNMASRQHIVGYVQRVNHSGRVSESSADLSTQVQISYARTLYEFMADVRSDALRFEGRITAAPADIITELREVLQDEGNAERFYSKLLYGDRPTWKGAAFKWTEAMGYNTPARVVPIEISGPSVATLVERERAAAQRAEDAPEPPPPDEEVRVGIDPNVELSPMENEYAEAFTSYHAAMRLASRPACTLDEYIRFWHGGKTVRQLQALNQVGGERLDDTYQLENVEDARAETTQADESQRILRGTTVRATAVFYDRIYRLRVGPGTGGDHLTPPSVSERGYTNPPDIQPASSTRGVPENYPQTRADWDRSLELYREKIRHRVRPST